MKNFFCAAAVAAFASASPALAQDDDFPRFVSVVGASSGGTFFFIANGVAQMLNQQIDGIRASAQSTAGTPRILETLHTGQGEFGYAQSSIAADAMAGIGQFEGAAMDNLAGMTFVFPNVMQVVVRRGAGVETPSDIAGKRWGVGEAGGGVEINSREMFEAIGEFDFPDGVRAEYVTGTQSSDLLRNGQLDGANMPAAMNFAAITDLMSTGEYELLDFPDDMIARLSDANPAYFAFEIPADTYPNQPEPVRTYAEANWLLARADLSESFVHRVLEVLYDNHQELVDLHQVNATMTLENSQNGSLIPLHPGAVRFFEERGVTVSQ